MDLFKIIQTLYEEKRRIDRAIAALEELGADRPAAPLTPVAGGPPKKKRGRPRKISSRSASPFE
ncbi:MAG: hypothetical protein FJW31_22345 [Acidobacteria bacterium]|nr:hypothetical protein [Acidobacteriota bacterium]